MNKLRVLDLFSGIGGFSLGLEATGGFETVAFCEIEEFPRKVLKKHWPEVPCYHDIRDLAADTLARDGIAIDVICGGFPCQDISSAGLRAGLQGARSGLWKEYTRLIGDIRPRFAIVENVSDLLCRGFETVLGDLAALRYDAEWHCLPACAVGADHIRDRIWVIAYPNSARSKPSNKRRRKQCQAQMGEDVASNNANADGSRLSQWMQTRKISEDARAISPWLGLALSSAPSFPKLDRSRSPVVGRTENGIPSRVDRCHAIGNAVVPQIPEIIGRAILEVAE